MLWKSFSHFQGPKKSLTIQSKIEFCILEHPLLCKRGGLLQNCWVSTSCGTRSSKHCYVHKGMLVCFTSCFAPALILNQVVSQINQGLYFHEGGNECHDIWLIEGEKSEAPST